jgi:hypothetical protein
MKPPKTNERNLDRAIGQITRAGFVCAAVEKVPGPISKSGAATSIPTVYAITDPHGATVRMTRSEVVRFAWLSN